MELRKLEVLQATSHVKMLLSFMPDAFLSRGGEHCGLENQLVMRTCVIQKQTSSNQIVHQVAIM